MRTRWPGPSLMATTLTNQLTRDWSTARASIWRSSSVLRRRVRKLLPRASPNTKFRTKTSNLICSMPTQKKTFLKWAGQRLREIGLTRRAPYRRGMDETMRAMNLTLRTKSRASKWRATKSKRVKKRREEIRKMMIIKTRKRWASTTNSSTIKSRRSKAQALATLKTLSSRRMTMSDQRSLGWITRLWTMQILIKSKLTKMTQKRSGKLLMPSGIKIAPNRIQSR